MSEMQIQVCDICVSYGDIEIKGYIDDEFNLMTIDDDGCITISPETSYGDQPYTDLLLQVNTINGVQSIVPNEVINTLVNENGDIQHTYINITKDNNSTIVGYTIDVLEDDCETTSNVKHKRNKVILFVKKDDKIYEHIFKENSLCDYSCNVYCSYDVNEISSLPESIVRCNYSVSTGTNGKLLFTLHRDRYEGEFTLMSGDKEILRYSDNKGDDYYPYGFVELNINYYMEVL